jgi:argininosuccinate lyase
MKRATYSEIAAAARAEERSACVEHIRGKMAEVSALQRRGRVSAQEAEQLNRRLDAIADGITSGLHLPDDHLERLRRAGL